MSDDEALDQSLEEAVRADAETVDRLVSAALTAAAVRRFRPGRLPAVGAGIVVLIAAAWLSWPRVPDREGVIRMRNVGEVILVDYPDGSRAIIGPEKADSTLFAGLDYVMFLGESQ